MNNSCARSHPQRFFVIGNCHGCYSGPKEELPNFCSFFCKSLYVAPLHRQKCNIRMLLRLHILYSLHVEYSYYKQIGAGLIGSGAIESAHRTVVQKRMKQSGQRWSYQGAKNMLNLRVIKMNGQREKIIQLGKTNFKGTA